MKSHTPATKPSTPARSSAARSGAFFRSSESASKNQAPFFQTALEVSQPGDKHEVEADAMADHVVNSQKSAQENSFFTPAPGVQRQPEISRVAFESQREDSLQRKEEEEEVQEKSSESTSIHRSPTADRPSPPGNSFSTTRLYRTPKTIVPHATSTSSRILRQARPGSHLTGDPRINPSRARGPPQVSNEFEKTLRSTKGGGQPMSDRTRGEMESSFNADFSNVRIHTDSKAQGMNREVNAKAFAHGQDIYFAPNRFQPEDTMGRHLLAHELTHVVQQGHAVQRSPNNLSRAPPSIQRIPTSMEEVRQEINDLADNIPGYTLGTVLIGYNPILGQNVSWSASAFFRGAAGLIPGGTKVYDKLNEGGAIDDAFAWIEGKINSYNLTWSRVSSLWDTAWDRMGITEGISGNVRIFKNTFSGFFSDVMSFIDDCISKLTEILKDLAVTALRTLFGDDGPAYDMITMVLGKDPVTDEPREWNTVEFLRSGLTLFGFENHLAKMEETGKLEEAAAWLDAQYALLSSALSGLISGVKDIWDSFSLATLAQPLDLLQRIVGVVVGFVAKLIQFVGNLAAMILELIKQALIALLKPHVNSIPGYRLFTVVLGSDPVTGEQIPRTADNFIKGFLDFVPKGIETYENLKKGNAIGKAMDWLSAQVEELGLSPAAIAARFTDLWTSFTIDDLMNPLPAFQRVGETFLGFIGDVLTLVGRVGLKLLEILFEVVMGAAGGDVLAMLKKGRATFLTIVKDPIGFVGNLVAAGKLGFEMFAGNILEHLKKGVFGWLFGALEGAGLQLPASFDFKGILSLGLQILGLTYRQIRPKLVKHLGEKAVSYIETAAEVVKILVTEGLAGVWKRLKELITVSIPEMVIGAIKGFIIEKIVKSAVVKIVSMLNPAGAVIQAIMAIYNTIMFFMERMQQIMQVVNSFVNSISKIANGQIGEAAAFVEKTMGNLVPVLISFLARLLGLGGISEKIKGIIKKIQAPVGKAIDKLIGWLVKMGKKLFKKAAQAGTGNMTPQQKLAKGMKLAVKAVNKFRGKKVGEAVLKPLLAGIKTRYDFQVLKVIPDGNKWAVQGKVNPTSTQGTQAETGTGSPEAATDSEKKVLAAFKAAHPSGRILMRKVNLTVDGVAAGQVKTHLAKLVKKKHLFYYESGGNDPYKMLTAEASKKGKRKIPSSGRRHLFGYNNPGHNTPTGRAVLAAWIDWDNIPQTQANTPASDRLKWSFLSGARYRSWKTGTRNIPEPKTVLGHETPANQHWNNGDGMKNTRSKNLKWGNLVGTYGGIEESKESSGEGGETYADPKPPQAAKCWWDPSHPEYPKVGGYDWDYTGAMTQLKTGSSFESHESEANQMADFVASGTGTQPAISRKPKVSSPSTPRHPTSGRPVAHSLPNSTRQPMEQSFGHDFRRVRVHHDEAAANLSDRISARAFTQGNNIYFNRGEYDPGSKRGRHLLAHELTHVVQQDSGRAPKSIQRTQTGTTTGSAAPSGGAVPPPPPGPPPTRFEVSAGPYRGSFLDTAASPRHLRISRISLPSVKRLHGSRYRAAHARHNFRLDHRNRQTAGNNQAAAWHGNADIIAASNQAFDTKQNQAVRAGAFVNNRYFFQTRDNPNFRIFPEETEFRRLLRVPTWDKDRVFRRFQIDHIVERQLDGNVTADQDNINNLELLDATANQSSGFRLNDQINLRLAGSVSALNAEHGGSPGFPALPAINNIRHSASWRVDFDRYDFSLPTAGGQGPHLRWTHNQIVRQRHSGLLRPIPSTEVSNMSAPGSVFFTSSPQGGTFLPAPAGPTTNWLPNIDYLGWTPVSGPVPSGQVSGHIEANFFVANRTRRFPLQGQPNHRIEVRQIDGFQGGYISREGLSTGMRRMLRFSGLSPVVINDAQFMGRQGIQAQGQVLPDVPLFENLGIDLLVSGEDVQLRRTFVANELNVPAPFEIDYGAISVFWSSSQGVGLEGTLAFSIDRVGTGQLTGGVSSEGGIALNGHFDFDTDLFSQARVEMSYANREWTVSGTLGIDEGKVNGVRSAEATVTYSAGNLSAEGNAQLDIPGVDSVALNLSLPEAGGFTMGGTANLSSDIPGIESGSVSVSVTKPADSEDYQVNASGTAVPSIPGVSTQLNVAYENGAITISGRAEYERGILSGSIELGATNRPIGEDGNPTDGEPTENFSFFGAGSITVQITPWLDGTVGVRFFPNAELEVSGQIALSNAYDVFSRIEVPERELIGMGFDIPIFAIPVGPRSIGLKATIAGGLRAYAGIGPGQLRDLSLGITYNPDHVDQTRITGRGRFVVPADAGLKLAVSASIGLDVLIGGVEGGLELAGGLGLEAEAGADVTVDWTPASGLALTASLFASIQPQLLFSIDGFIRAWILFYEQEWRWNLADYRYGPDLRFGVRLPITYREGEPFNPSFDDIELTYPQINAPSFLRGLIRDIRGSRD